MDPVSSPRFSVVQVGVTLVVGSVALLMLGLQPVLLGEMVDREMITLEGVGMVAMGEILALGIGVALSDALAPVALHRTIAALAAVIVAVVDLATLQAGGDNGFLVARAAAGLAEGAMLWAATNVIVRSARPESVAAVFMVVQTVAQACVAALLSRVVIPRASWQGGFELLAALTGLCAILAALLPGRLAPLQAHGSEKMRWTVARVLPLIVALLQMSAIGSLWAYLEPLGKAVGLNDSDAQSMAAVVLALQVVGGIAATAAVRRFAAVPTLGVSSVVLVGVAGGWLLLSGGSMLPITALCAVFGFTWLFLMPFQIGLAFRADVRGRVAMLIPAAQLIGSAFGPFVASRTVSGDDASPVPIVSLGFAIAAGAALIVGSRFSSKTIAAQADVLAPLDARDEPEPAF